MAPVACDWSVVPPNPLVRVITVDPETPSKVMYSRTEASFSTPDESILSTTNRPFLFWIPVVLLNVALAVTPASKPAPRVFCRPFCVGGYIRSAGEGENEGEIDGLAEGDTDGDTLTEGDTDTEGLTDGDADAAMLLIYNLAVDLFN